MILLSHACILKTMTVSPFYITFSLNESREKASISRPFGIGAVTTLAPYCF